MFISWNFLKTEIYNNFYILLLEYDIIKKQQVDINIIKLDFKQIIAWSIYYNQFKILHSKQKN